jgi:hypothetical protein
MDVKTAKDRREAPLQTPTELPSNATRDVSGALKPHTRKHRPIRGHTRSMWRSCRSDIPVGSGQSAVPYGHSSMAIVARLAGH